MNKITPEHLARSAIVYIRQSTPHQVANNLESQRRQYGLVERGRQLGWSDVEVIDDDLGRSGGGTARPGFEKLLAAICESRIGAVLSIEASRLARNGRDWHTLLEFCGVVNTLIIDEDGIYDPRSPNDRLLLGMKGTMSEMEVSVFHQRSREAIQQKARRGELFLTVAIGYMKTEYDRIEKDPDRQIQDAVALVFAKFAELQTVRQVLLWFRRERILLPTLVQGTRTRPIEWKAPVYQTVRHMLTNPVYAGAYAFGRRAARVTIKEGRKRIVRTRHRDPKDWNVLIKDHHEGYISWAQFERNQTLIADNANGKSYLRRGSIRHGEALLTGLFRCGRCGKKLAVAYSGKGGTSQRYVCRGAFSTIAAYTCIAFGGVRVDRAVAQEVLERLQPLGIEAALAALEARGQEQSEKQRQLDNALQAARYEASRAHRQYDAVDPENRLVASELERRWNECLARVNALEEDLAKLAAEPASTLSLADRDRLTSLGKDLARAWDSPGATMETKKKIVRLLINEIVVNMNDTIDLVIHWQGGDHTRLVVKKYSSGNSRWVTETEVLDLVRHLARHMPDEIIASLLNRSGRPTARGHNWTRTRVCSLRHQNRIAVYREGERAERGEVSLLEATKLLSVSPATIRRMIHEGVLPATQFCKGAPWVMRAIDLQHKNVRKEADRRRLHRPPSGDPAQSVLDL
jgi:DNA invertase Pin-like site-specific DNA recombinase